MNSISIRRTLLTAPLISLLLLQSTPSQSQDQKPGRKVGVVKHAQAILGKPLTDSQKKAVRAANAKRQQAIKPIQLSYRTAVAKALGLTLAQYEDRERKLRQNKKGG